MERSITTPITDQEKANIRALEWLSFEPAQYEECLHRSNYLTRKYLRKDLPITLANTAFHESIRK